jgi:hypothetical protein
VGLPVIGYLVPNCDLGSMILAGDWKMVAVDLTGLFIGLVLATIVWKMRAKRVDVRVERAVRAHVLSPAE